MTASPPPNRQRKEMSGGVCSMSSRHCRGHRFREERLRKTWRLWRIGAGIRRRRIVRITNFARTGSRIFGLRKYYPADHRFSAVEETEGDVIVSSLVVVVGIAVGQERR